MRTAPSPAAPGRALARVLKAVGSLLVLVAAVVGLPLLLVWVTPVIWQAGHDDLAHLLDRQDTGSAFLLLLVAVGWLGWAQFTFCAVRELTAQLRGRTWHAPRGLSSSQRAAAVLIGSILVLLPTSSALASPARATPAASSAHVPQQTHARASAGRTTPDVTTPRARRYTVREARPAESLWSIAEKELGDGERWREIAALNEGRAMGDGQVFRANSFLQPGWELDMPETSSSPAAPAMSGGASSQLDESEAASSGQEERVVTVHSGDYLSKIAEKELGDGDRWPRLFEASRGQPQPGGLPEITDPDVIYAGQRLTVPGATTGRHDRPSDHGEANTTGRPDTPPAHEHPHQRQERSDTPAASPSASATHAPETSAPGEQTIRPTDKATSPNHQHAPSRKGDAATATYDPGASASATPAPSASGEGSPTATATGAPPSQPAASPLQLRTVLGAGALLAATITGALALRRLLQRRRRKPGQTIAMTPEVSPAEAKLAAAAEPDGAARLDAALRTLAHLAAQKGDSGVPALRGARIGARLLEVLPEDLAQEPRAPFITGQAGWWQLPANADLLSEDQACEVPAPYPGLVTVGTTESGDLVLANLTQLPSVLLDGNPVHLTEVCTSLALELGMSPWAGDVEVVTIGFGEDLPQLLPTCRIAHMRQPAHALRDLTERLLEAHQMPETEHQPYLLLCAATMDADTAWQLAEVIDKAGRVPVTLVAPASSAAAHFPDAQILNASISTPQRFDYLGVEIVLQRLEHAAYQQITAALALSGQPADGAEGSWQEVPDELDVEADAEPDLTETPTAAEAEADSAPAASASDGVDDGAMFPALLAASADPSSLRLLPDPNHSQTHGDCIADEEQAPPTTEPEANSTKTATEKGPVPPAQRPHPAAADDKDSGAHDLNAPEIRVLGPVEVDRVSATGHGPRIAQLAALMFFRPGRTADALCAHMDPLNPWSVATLNARFQGLRRALGNDASGNAYVPRRRGGDDPYLLSPAVRCDWTRFLHLAERALPQAAAGLPDLEKALSLVRGRPFGTRPLPWAEPQQQEMITRIIDVAHTVATYRTPAGPNQDLGAARQAIATGLEVDESAELLYRDWMRIEAAAGNRQGLHMAISRVQQVNRALDCDLELETEQLISDLLNGSGPSLRKAL
ncbi:LysM peptidoglycan-binding domain-containing protein [Streptomyces sp. NPDC002004]